MSQQIVQQFLGALERRDLDSASALLADDAEMIFPGGNAFTDLPSVVAWARGRYKSVRKTFDRFDEVVSGDTTVVYCYGGLHGEGLNGEAIKNVRFIDRFVIKSGKIKRQDVWNDLAERER